MKQFILLPALYLLASCGSSGTKSEPEFPAENIAVYVAPVKTYNNRNAIYTTGLITTNNEASYAFKTGGIIERIYVREGQFFKKGQLLASLKTTEIDAQLSQAEFAYQKAARDYTRASNLYKDSVASLEQLQNSRTGLEIAGKAVEATAFNKKFSYIYAAADGFVAKKIANENEVIAAGVPVFAINETNGNKGWILKAGVTDKEWAAINKGDKALVTMDAFPADTFHATVLRKAQITELTSGALEIDLSLELKEVKPAAGMFAKATLLSGDNTELPTIPYDALIEADGNKAFVFVPVDSGKVKRMPVLIESFNNKEVIIKSGLENIKEVIVSNSAFLNEKSTITIIK